MIFIEERPSYDEYFMEMAYVVSKRSTCLRRKVGAILVKDKHILSTGYVGSAKGLKHCDEAGHLMKTITHEDGKISQHCTRTSHAEQNAVCQAAKLGIALEGSTIYCKMEPCATCAKMIINAGIKRVVCGKRYHAAEETRELFRQAGVQLEAIKEEVLEYDNQ